MTTDLDEAIHRAERGLILTARHGDVLIEALKAADVELTELRELKISGLKALAEQRCASCLLELEKFLERETLVRVLVDVSAEVLTELEYHGSKEAPALRSAMECARDFEVQP